TEHDAVLKGWRVTTCVLLILASLLVWLTTTHLIGRFAVPIVAPLAVLTGIVWARARPRGGRISVATLVIVAGAINIRGLASPRRGCALVVWGRDTRGKPDLMQQIEPVGNLNKLLDEGKRILLIGEARSFYLHRAPPQYQYFVVFNRNPFAEAAASRTPA